MQGNQYFCRKKKIIKYFKEIQILGGLNFPWDKTSLALPSPEEATLLCVQPTRRRSSSSISLPRQAFFPQIPAWQRETTWCPRLTDRTDPAVIKQGLAASPALPNPAPALPRDAPGDPNGSIRATPCRPFCWGRPGQQQSVLRLSPCRSYRCLARGFLITCKMRSPPWGAEGLLSNITSHLLGFEGL